VDITARKELEGQLLQALKMESVGRLAGGMAHDFNNMLSAIRGYAELLIEDLDGSTPPPLSTVRESVTAISDAADRAATLTAQLLAFSSQQHAEVDPGPYVMLAVTDTGKGMDAETKAHIFEPFFTTKAVGAGTGLGLATTYGIVRQSGGHIWVYSEPGAGSVFKLYFPRAEGQPTPAPSTEATQSTAGTGRVLVVEDEGMVRDMTARVLDRAGYTVLLARNAAEALAIIGEDADPIDVLVTDVVMPGMSGPDLAEEVLGRYPGMGIVLVSGYTAASLKLDDVLARGAIFVSKPFNPSDLVRAVAEARRQP